MSQNDLVSLQATAIDDAPTMTCSRGILLLLSTAGTISMCFNSFEQERFDAFESIVLIPLPTRGMLFMISAYDSIAMYLAISAQFIVEFGALSPTLSLI